MIKKASITSIVNQNKTPFPQKNISFNTPEITKIPSCIVDLRDDEK